MWYPYFWKHPILVDSFLKLNLVAASMGFSTWSLQPDGLDVCFFFGGLETAIRWWKITGVFSSVLLGGYQVLGSSVGLKGCQLRLITMLSISGQLATTTFDPQMQIPKLSMKSCFLFFLFFSNLILSRQPKSQKSAGSPTRRLPSRTMSNWPNSPRWRNAASADVRFSLVMSDFFTGKTMDSCFFLGGKRRCHWQ